MKGYEEHLFRSISVKYKWFSEPPNVFRRADFISLFCDLVSIRCSCECFLISDDVWTVESSRIQPKHHRLRH
jgi:hypothetical protein